VSLHLEAGSPNREVLEKHYSSFYASDAVLARVLAMALSQSQVGSFIETEERIELVFGMAAVLAYPLLCCKKILVHVCPKIRVLPSGSFPQTPDFSKISPWHIDRRSVLSLT